MTRRLNGKVLVCTVALVISGLMLGGCGGGGGGGGGGNGVLQTVSFVGFPVSPSPMGPNASVPLPEVFIDQTLEFTFDGNVDAGIFGGFLPDPADPTQPLEFLGVAPSSLGGIPYFAYVNQTQAAQSLQIRQNIQGGPLLTSYIVGRHRDKPNTIVVDPRVTATNPFGLPFNAGYIANNEYVYNIPNNTGLMISGGPAQAVGSDPLTLPVIVPPFSPQPNFSTLFRAGGSFGPDPIPPEVTEIRSSSGVIGIDGSPTVEIPATDAIEVEFTKAIDPTTVNVLTNFTIRNLDVTPSTAPNGVIIPGMLTFNPGNTVATFMPNPTFGPGVDAANGIGFTIEVRVGNFGIDPAMQSPIQGVPSGPPPPTQLPLANSRRGLFQTQACPPCQAAVTLIEDFSTNAFEDGAFTARFNPVVWGTSVMPGMENQLLAEPISGNARATFNAGGPDPAGLGTRMQVTFVPNPLSTNPQGLFAPFDDPNNCTAPPNPGGGPPLPCINPMGGAHIMHGYSSADLGGIANGLELIEWGPFANFVQGTVYPSYEMWCGQTSTALPSNVGAGGGGLAPVFANNYNVPTIQPPSTAPGSSGGVAVTPGPANYNTGAGAGTGSGYFPFPDLNPPFLYEGGTNNFIYEVNIEPGMQIANLNRYRATATNPVRRLVAASIMGGLGPVIAGATGFDIYDHRFTFVAIESSGQSIFYEAPIPSAAMPTYVGITLTPSPFAQPANTSALWEFEAASAILAPNAPAPGSSSQFQTFFSGTPAFGVQDNSILALFSGRRFLRYRTTFQNDPATNGAQAYDNIIVAVTF